GDRITRFDEKTPAVILIELLRVHFKDSVSIRTLPSHYYSLRRGDTRIPTRHRNGLQKVDSAGTGLGHFKSTWPAHLSQDREASLGITWQRDVNSWVHEIIAAVQPRKFRGGLCEG